MKVNILIKGETFVDVIPLSRGKRESLNYKDNQIPVYTVLNVDSDKLNHIVKETIKGYDTPGDRSCTNVLCKSTCTWYHI